MRRTIACLLFAVLSTNSLAESISIQAKTDEEAARILARLDFLTIDCSVKINFEKEALISTMLKGNVRFIRDLEIGNLRRDAKTYSTLTVCNAVGASLGFKDIWKY